MPESQTPRRLEDPPKPCLCFSGLPSIQLHGLRLEKTNVKTSLSAPTNYMPHRVFQWLEGSRME